jgi:hypothetical protein
LLASSIGWFEDKERENVKGYRSRWKVGSSLPAYVIGCSLAEVFTRFGLCSDVASLQGVLLSLYE